MKKSIAILTILLIFTVMASGCASKKTATPEENIPANINMPAEDILGVTQTEGVAIEEPDFDIETNVDLASLI